MKKNNFVLSFFSSILCIYVLRFFWAVIALFLHNKLSWSVFSIIIEFLSPFISYWFIKKYLSNNFKIKRLFLDYTDVKKYTISLFLIESTVILLLIILGIDLASIIFIYLIFLSHFFSSIWYLPFFVIANINRKTS